MENEMLTQDFYNKIKTNYGTLTDVQKEKFVNDLAEEYGKEKAISLVEAIKSDSFTDYSKILSATLPQGEVENSKGETMSVDNNYDMSAEDANVCPNCGSAECTCEGPTTAEQKVANVDMPEERDSVIEDAVETTIDQLQAMPADKVNAIVANFQQNISDDFSEGITKLYNTRSADFSKNMGILVGKYYKNLQKMARDGHRDFSEVQNSDLIEYSVYGKPSDFSIMNTMVNIVNALDCDFSEEPEMFRSVEAEIEDARVDELVTQLSSIYDELPSDEQKDAFAQKIMSLVESGQGVNTEELRTEFSINSNSSAQTKSAIGEFSANCDNSAEPEAVASAEESGTDGAEGSLEAQLSQNDNVKALAEKYKNLSSDAAKAAMKAAMESQWGAEVAEYIVGQAEGQNFSATDEVQSTSLPEGQVSEAQPVQDTQPEATVTSEEVQAPSESSLEELGNSGDMFSVGPVDIMDEKLDNSEALEDETFVEGSLEDISSAVEGVSDAVADEVPEPNGSAEVSEENVESLESLA